MCDTWLVDSICAVKKDSVTYLTWSRACAVHTYAQNQSWEDFG